MQSWKFVNDFYLANSRVWLGFGLKLLEFSQFLLILQLLLANTLISLTFNMLLDLFIFLDFVQLLLFYSLSLSLNFKKIVFLFLSQGSLSPVLDAPLCINNRM